MSKSKAAATAVGVPHQEGGTQPAKKSKSKSKSSSSTTTTTTTKSKKRSKSKASPAPTPIPGASQPATEYHHHHYPSMKTDSEVTESFTSFYLQQSTREYAEDLDRVRTSEDFNHHHHHHHNNIINGNDGPSAGRPSRVAGGNDGISLLIRALTQGVEMFPPEKRRRIVADDDDDDAGRGVRRDHDDKVEEASTESDGER